VIDVSIGKPIASEGRQPDEMMREVQEWIEAEMRRLDPEGYPAVSGAVSAEAAPASSTARPT
jgi:1-acyl-sn-glycerol-3-phosphate acyltransferase